MTAKGGNDHKGKGWSKGKGKSKGKFRSYRGKGKGKGKWRPPWQRNYGGKSYGKKGYMFSAAPEEKTSPARLREERLLHHARYGIDLTGPSASSASVPMPSQPSSAVHFDISREEDFLGRRHQPRSTTDETSPSEALPERIEPARKILNFPVLIHHGADGVPDINSYHMVSGKQRRGLLVDPGAAAGLIGSETLRDLMEHCLRPNGLDGKMQWSDRSTSVTGISGKGDSTLAEVTFEFNLDGSRTASFSADVLGGEGSLCPALIGNPSLRNMHAVIFTQFFENNDGLLVCHPDSDPSSKESTTMIRLLLTDSGHYIIPLDGLGLVESKEQQRAVNFVNQASEMAESRWNDCKSHYRYCFHATSAPLCSPPDGAEHERSETEPKSHESVREESQTPEVMREESQTPEVMREESIECPEPSPKHQHRDHWQKNGNQWIRHHVRERSNLFVPQNSKFPDRLSTLTTERWTTLHYDDGTSEVLQDEWTDEQNGQRPVHRKWTGTTVFQVKENTKDLNTQHQTPPSEKIPETIHLADFDDYVFQENELRVYEEDHFPEHIPEHKRSYLQKFYKAVPEEFYTRLKRAPVTPSNCLEWLERVKKKKKFHFWELCSGSSRLTLLALMSGLTVLFPVDMRYGWDIGHVPHQMLLRKVHDELIPECLHASPNCRPWSISSNGRDPEIRERERAEEQPCLDEVKKMCKKQHKQGKMFVLEQPWSSALWQHLSELPGERQRTDQCQFGAQTEEGLPVLKPTGFLSNRNLQRSKLRCSGHGREHGWLQGQVGGQNRTTLASVYPRKLCQALIKDIKKSVHFVGHVYYECERCQLGRFAPKFMEHTFMPGECRYGKYPEDHENSKKSKDARKATEKEDNLMDIFKREALTNRKIASCALASGNEIGFDNEQAAIFKYAMSKILAESVEAFDKTKEVDRDYIHWIRDPITLAWLRSILQKHISISGVCAHLQPWTKPVPTPHLKADISFMRLIAIGTMESWKLLPTD